MLTRGSTASTEHRRLGNHSILHGNVLIAALREILRGSAAVPSPCFNFQKWVACGETRVKADITASQRRLLLSSVRPETQGLVPRTRGPTSGPAAFSRVFVPVPDRQERFRVAVANRFLILVPVNVQYFGVVKASRGKKTLEPHASARANCGVQEDPKPAEESLEHKGARRVRLPSVGVSSLSLTVGRKDMTEERRVEGEKLTLCGSGESCFPFTPSGTFPVTIDQENESSSSKICCTPAGCSIKTPIRLDNLADCVRLYAIMNRRAVHGMIG
ncbi:unnamed protein product [Notodromas monacha]|uniref:Uncharacterized protein n=1 Tax=Notodromas monacha TaxID=399045 RepID=A0A7R9BNF7_9CRUS|nr:unnamed protein product [Notodromas monacha]CAG0918702.1 unnamed protein product [Notodromas monacha]